MRFGIQSLSNRELLALLIRHGNKCCTSLEIADQLLHKSNGMGALGSLVLHDLIQVRGISHVKALELLACFEVARRMSYEQCLNRDVIQDPESLIQWLNLEIGYQKQEMFLVVYLNVKNEILHYEILFKGTLDRSLVHPREIYKTALMFSSARILVVHNHPSGSLKPSNEDLMITSQLAEIGNLMKIRLLDHLIVSGQGSFSFKQAGLLD